jgi:hypothetical protein
MSRTRATVLFAAGVVVIAVAGPLAFGPPAGATTDSGSIGPHQTFVGLVNGNQTSASIEVACPEGIRPGGTGPPASGQTIGVRSPSSSATPGGTTGSRARTIVARFGPSGPAATSTVTFTRYGSVPIPTTLRLPCIGSGTLVFTPRPTSATAQSETMTVTYVTPCHGICADGRR